MALQDYINNIGKQGKDSVTGFTGTIVLVSQSLNGMVRYALQPKVAKDGKYPDGIDLDVDRVKVSGTRAKLDFGEQAGVQLGDKAESIVHGFKGLVTDLTWHLNGCVMALVTSEVNNKGLVPVKWCHASQLRITEKQKLKEADHVRPGDRPPGSTFGGSYSIAARYR